MSGTRPLQKISLGFFLLVVLAGCAAPATGSPSPSSIRLVPSVKGCAETDQGTVTRTKGEDQDQEPTIEVIGNTITYRRAIHHLCCRKVDFDYSMEGALITLHEIWSGTGCKCECFSEIGASLEDIPAGSYTVRVYEGGTQPGGNEPMEERLIIEKEISIP